MSIDKSHQQSKARFKILSLIFLSVVINYMDRSNMAVAAPMLSEELGFTTVHMGYIFAAFGATYALMQIPGGILVDYVKPRILYPFILTAWSIATLIQGFVSSVTALIGCRMAIGIFEAPSYPANNKIVTSWFSEEERASAIAAYTSGQFIGLAFLTPVLIFIQASFGWRGLFIISGLIGIVWAAIWYFVYRDPSDVSEVAKEEAKTEVIAFEWKNLREAFSHKKLWGIYIGQFCLGGLLIFFLTWFPTYLMEFKGFSTIKTGFLGSIPYIFAFFGVLISGFLSDFLVRKGVSKEVSRKAPIIAGMLLSTSIVGANYVDSEFAVIALLSIAFFGNGLASITWVFVSLLAPERMVGLVGGCFNFIGGLSGVCVPIIIGYLVEGGDFKPALIFIGALALIGLSSYLFLVGKVEQIEIKPKASALQN
ncbi:MFS transporter [Colwellia sp. UCD-KL20]|uniref:MFS transporter n=1 Tax=Colwellia sp. UCD-KL20 TaxID=1917165 RepID=UPI0009708D8E|nr:MFS transporter [Colwellia sp. UCD-KL20]